MGGRDDERNLLVSGSLFDSDGRPIHFDEYDDPATRRWIHRERLRAVRARVRARGVRRPHARGRLLHEDEGDSDRRLGHGVRRRAQPQLDEQVFVDLTWGSGVPETLAVEARAHHGFYVYEGDYVFADGDSTYVNHDKAVR